MKKMNVSQKVKTERLHSKCFENKERWNISTEGKQYKEKQFR